MPRYNIWIRNENLKRWQEIEDKSAFVNGLLREQPKNVLAPLPEPTPSVLDTRGMQYSKNIVENPDGTISPKKTSGLTPDPGWTEVASSPRVPIQPLFIEPRVIRQEDGITYTDEGSQV